MITDEIRHNILSSSDTQLIDMLVNGEDYTEDAIMIAKEEIEKRKIDEIFYSDCYRKLDLEKKERERKANEDLSLKEKILLLFFPFSPLLIIPMRLKIIPFMPSSRFYHENGYKRKSSKVIWFKVFSYFLWVVIIVGAFSIENYIKRQRYQEYINKITANQTFERDGFNFAAFSKKI